MSRLINLNKLTADDRGIYSHPDSSERDFAYSDGSDAERYLHEVLDNASDLSSDSEELQLAIRDWPSEYHLSPKRANLLRPLPLGPGARVLELGCGCGAITRYLGETGCDVEAIEGSAVRAGLARLRCRGLDNVSIVQANFNRLTLPDDEYDHVLLIGVAEYARRFSPDAQSDRGAVVDLLTRVRRSLKPGGKLLIAIENRTGMKYLHGAHEDHYSLRFVGIDDYSIPAGIRTYTRREWREIADDVGFGHHVFLYPFPDYKIPTVYLGDSYVERDLNAWCHLEGIDSVDYTFLFDPYVPESLTWQGYNAAGVLGDLANSFMLVLCEQDDLEPFADIEFCHLPDFRRKREHCTVITKTRGDDAVYRRALARRGESQPESISEPYLEGTLLSALWARSIMIPDDPSRFHARLREYLDFIETFASTRPLPVDLLPNNIVVDSRGSFHVFDQEWRDVESVDIDYLLFRALLIFANHYHAAIRQFARHMELYTIEGFIGHAFRVLQRGNRLPRDFCQREDAFQDRVLLKRDGDTASILDTPIADNAVRAYLYPTLAWSENGDFDEEHELTEKLAPGSEPSILEFTLPAGVKGIERLRFTPCDENRPHDSGYFNIDSVHVLLKKDDHLETLWSLDGEDLVLNKALRQQVAVVQVGRERVLAVTGDDPALVFEPRAVRPAGDRQLLVRLSVRYSRSREYRLARQDFLVKEAALEQRITALERALEHARGAERELAGIKASRTWRTLTSLRRRLSGTRRG